MKRNYVRYSILAAVFAMFVASFASVSAWQPPLTHALIHLKNTSTQSVTVYFKWGNNGRWQRTIIPRGGGHYFNYRYDGNSRSSPDFFVRIDVDTNGTRYVEHVLSRGASPDESSMRYGHHFNIKQLAGTETRYIDAVSSGATVKVTDKNSSRPDLR